MNNKNNAVELRCYLDYLIAKYVVYDRENDSAASKQYNSTESSVVHRDNSYASIYKKIV